MTSDQPGNTAARPCEPPPPAWTQRYNLYQDTWNKIANGMALASGCLTVAVILGFLGWVFHTLVHEWDTLSDAERAAAVALLLGSSLILIIGFFRYLIEHAPKRPSNPRSPGEPR